MFQLETEKRVCVGYKKRNIKDKTAYSKLTASVDQSLTKKNKYRDTTTETDIVCPPIISRRLYTFLLYWSDYLVNMSLRYTLTVHSAVNISAYLAERGPEPPAVWKILHLRVHCDFVLTSKNEAVLFYKYALR